MRAPARGSTARRLAALALAAVVLAASCSVAEVRPGVLVDPATRAAVGQFVRGMFPVDLSPAFLVVVTRATLRTLAIAIAGTALSLSVAAPLAFLSTGSLWRRGVVVDSEHRAWVRYGGALASVAARGVLGFFRAVPDLVWALAFVVAVGLGPMAGALAIAVAYGGVLGRVWGDAFEAVDPRPIEAVHATGATRAQTFAFAIWPQARGVAIAYLVYAFECAVRAAAVVGFIGAGGLGYEIALSMRMFEYGQVLTLVGALLALVTAGDAVGRALRRSFRANAPPGFLAHVHNEAGARMRARPALVATAAIVVLACALWGSGFFARDVIDASMAAHVVRFVGGMFPPAIDASFLRGLARPIAQTLAVSVVGTTVGVAIGAVGGAIAADPYSADDRALTIRARAVAAVRRGARMSLALLRAIPELLWVLVCVVAVGLGPFAGSIALGLHTGGVLGRLYADTFEEVAPRPIEALRATGAGPIQVLVFGVWPQARSMLASYTLLRWETNLRASTVLGLAGGGGVGVELYNDAQLGFYPRVATLIGVVYLMVAATGWMGERIRQRLG